MTRRSVIGILSRARPFVIVVILIALAAIANLPSTTQGMVNFVPQTVTQPLYAKAIAFLDRDIQMRQLAARVVGDTTDPSEKAERILRWTTANVRPTPAGMPVVDDHPYNIVVRGYGEYDQAADVFANLAGYSGLPGGLVFSRTADGSALYAFGLLEIAGKKRIFDVREGRALRNKDGSLASLDELRANPTLLDGLPAPSAANGVPYRVLIDRLEASPHRLPSDQMPLSRLLSEIGRIFRRE